LKPIAHFAQLLFIVAASVFVYGFVSVAKDGEQRRSCDTVCALSPNYASSARRAPDFELPALRGGTVRLSQFRGKVVILNFWSKTCPPCLEEMPSLAELGHELSYRDDIVLLTITTDESAEDAKKTLSSVLGESMVDGKAPFYVLLDPEAEVVGDRFGTKLYPETWFIDPDGVVRARVDGARNWSDAVTISYAESLLDPVACPIEFRAAAPVGSQAGLCAELGH
jgi:thiol-disulfide isomerase/thioredoxin